VLIADADSRLLEAYRDLLTREGIAVSTAQTGPECLNRLRDFAPDVLVLELDLKWGWGEGILALMIEGTDVPWVPVIILSTSHDPEVWARFAAFSVSEQHVKPVAPALLLQRVRRLLRKIARKEDCLNQWV